MKKKNSLKEKKLNEDLINLVLLRKKYKKTNSNSDMIIFNKAANNCIKQLEYLVKARTRKYKGFPNYDDLCQEARMSLYSALNTYEPDKGNFFWWAKKYMETKVSREANCHSVIKIPLKHARNIQPYKVPDLPTIIDDRSPFDGFSEQQISTIIQKAVSKLPENQRRIIELRFEIMNDPRRERYGKRAEPSIGYICDKLKIKRVDYKELIEEAKINLKNNLEVCLEM